MINLETLVDAAPPLRMTYYTDLELEQSRSNAPNLNVQFGELQLVSTHLK
jgi:hypothetical protein